VWNALVGYSYLTGDSTYDDIVSEALQFQLGDFDAYMPPNQTSVIGNDDQSCWGLAAMTAAEVEFPKPKNAEWVDYAANVWNTQAQRFDIEEKKRMIHVVVVSDGKSFLLTRAMNTRTPGPMAISSYFLLVWPSSPEMPPTCSTPTKCSSGRKMSAWLAKSIRFTMAPTQMRTAVLCKSFSGQPRTVYMLRVRRSCTIW
jgi:hypothetical protein